jgi:hypothetical protein
MKEVYYFVPLFRTTIKAKSRCKLKLTGIARQRISWQNKSLCGEPSTYLLGDLNLFRIGFFCTGREMIIFEKRF